MSEDARTGSPVSLLTLGAIRQYIRRSHAVMMTVFFAAVYALGSMVLGSMLILTHLSPPYYVEIVWSGGAPAWNYPGLLIVEPWGVVTLPFVPTIAMVLVSIGVGIGMAVAVLLGVALLRNRQARAAEPAAAGSVAGLTPAMIALVTLGACCSTTAAATAGVGLVGQVSGTSAENLLLNNWYLGLFQIVVVWVALLAQELILRVYGGLYGLPRPGGATATSAEAPPRVDRRALAAAALRVALLVGGVTWSLAMVAQWTTVNPLSASPVQWYSWIVQHQLLAAVAIAVALFPDGVARGFAERGRTRAVVVLRALLLVGGLSLAIGVPPPLASSGAAGLVNEIWAAIVGANPAGGGAVAASSPAGLAFSWLVQYALLGGLAIAIALVPVRVLAPIAGNRPGEARESDRAGVGEEPDPTAGVPGDGTAGRVGREIRAEAPPSGAGPADS